MADLIQVKATDPTRCALWERDAAHPDGEAFVYGDGVFSVALTPKVQGLLNLGVLVRVNETTETAPVEMAESPKPHRKAKA